MGAINQNIYLAGYSPWGRRESETTERLRLCTHTHIYVPLELQLKTNYLWPVLSLTDYPWGGDGLACLLALLQ